MATALSDLWEGSMAPRARHPSNYPELRRSRPRARLRHSSAREDEGPLGRRLHGVHGRRSGPRSRRHPDRRPGRNRRGDPPPDRSGRVLAILVLRAVDLEVQAIVKDTAPQPDACRHAVKTMDEALALLAEAFREEFRLE